MIKATPLGSHFYDIKVTLKTPSKYKPFLMQLSLKIGGHFEKSASITPNQSHVFKYHILCFLNIFLNFRLLSVLTSYLCHFFLQYFMTKFLVSFLQVLLALSGSNNVGHPGHHWGFKRDETSWTPRTYPLLLQLPLPLPHPHLLTLHPRQQQTVVHLNNSHGGRILS